LKLDCNATDFYSYPSYPVYLLYNPYQEEKELRYEVSFEKTDLYDIVSGQYIEKEVDGFTTITLPADQASLVVEIPSGEEVNENSIYKKR